MKWSGGENLISMNEIWKKKYLILVVQMKTIANHDSELSGNISSPSDYKFLRFFCEKKNERWELQWQVKVTTKRNEIGFNELNDELIRSPFEKFTGSDECCIG